MLHLVNWNQSIGCSESADMGKEVWVRIFGLSLHLWCCSILKKIGDGYGGIIELDEELFFAPILSWARILVRIDRRKLPQFVDVEDGSYKFSLQLWWEIPPCVRKLNMTRVSTKYVEAEVRDELHDISLATKRVARGGMPYKDAAKDFKSGSAF